MKILPALLPTTVVGSYPQPDWLIDRQKLTDAGVPRVRAREVWRPKVLNGAVPFIHRVSSYAWTHSGNEERQRLKEAVENALHNGEGYQ